MQKLLSEIMTYEQNTEAKEYNTDPCISWSGRSQVSNLVYKHVP